MDRPIKLWEFLLGLVGLLISIGTIVYNTGTRDAGLGMKVEYHEKRLNTIEVNQAIRDRELNIKIDRMMEMQNNIMIQLERKVDRK